MKRYITLILTAFVALFVLSCQEISITVNNPSTDDNIENEEGTDNKEETPEEGEEDDSAEDEEDTRTKRALSIAMSAPSAVLRA